MKPNFSSIKKKKALDKAKKKNEKIKNRQDKKTEPKINSDDLITFVDEDGNVITKPRIDHENENIQ
jgi:hypothetical protein